MASSLSMNAALGVRLAAGFFAAALAAGLAAGFFAAGFFAAGAFAAGFFAAGLAAGFLAAALAAGFLCCCLAWLLLRPACCGFLGCCHGGDSPEINRIAKNNVTRVLNYPVCASSFRSEAH